MNENICKVNVNLFTPEAERAISILKRTKLFLCNTMGYPRLGVGNVFQLTGRIKKKLSHLRDGVFRISNLPDPVSGSSRNMTF